MSVINNSQNVKPTKLQIESQNGLKTAKNDMCSQWPIIPLVTRALCCEKDYIIS